MGLRLLVPLVVLVAWIAVTHWELIDPIFLPPPGDLLDRAQELQGELLTGLRVSLTMVFGGFLIGGTVGIFAGLLFGYSRLARDLFEFSVDAVRPIPLFALIPLFILWLGIGMAPQIALVAVGVFLIMSLATIESVRNVPQIYVRAALACGASRFQMYRTVVVPAIIPHMLAGARFAIAAAWGLDVAAEYTGSQEGLGYIMIVREQSLDTAGILLIVAIFSAIAIFFDRLMGIATRHLTRWTVRSETGFVRDMLGGR
jgi:ABC-type nitrate/sulfonate/bicarbonate transport system permease component